MGIANRIFMKHRHLLLLLFFMTPVALLAQRMNGFVKDADTGEPLIGATITVKGTTIGTIADENGYYELLNIPTGNVIILASYLGYLTDSVGIALAIRETRTFDFNLRATSMELNEVVITIQARGQISALNQQLNSDYISNVISSEKLQEVPDATVADALGRVPGVTVVNDGAGEGDKIQIRGMEPRLNLVTVNGVRAPSLDQATNAVSLSGISPYMIESIEVQKSLTPDKDGDVVGGIVDIKIKDAPEGFHANAVFQNNFNSLVNSYFNPRATLELSNRFFHNKLGILLVGNYEDIDRSNQNMSAGGDVERLTSGNRIRLDNANFSANEYSRKRYGGSLYLDYRLPNGKIKAMSFLNGLNNFNYSRSFSSNFQHSNYNRNVNHNETNTISIINSIALEQKLFLNSTIQVGISYSLAKNHTPVNYSLGTEYRSSILTENRITPAVESYLTNPEKYPYDAKILIEDDFMLDSAFYLTSVSSTDNTFDEDELIGYIDWIFPFKAGNSVSGNFKVGVKYRNKNRQYDANTRSAFLATSGSDKLRAWIPPANPNLDFTGMEDYIGNQSLASFHILDDYDDKILDDQFVHRGFVSESAMMQIIKSIDDDNWSEAHHGAISPEKNKLGDYSGSEQITAGYAMADVNITRYLQLVGGVRYEDIRTNFRSFGLIIEGVDFFSFVPFDDSLANRHNSFLLPMVNLKIKPFAWLQFRLAYTQSIARPKYTSFMPKYTLGRLGDLTDIGNPGLKPALSHNLDAYVSVKVNERKLGMAGVLTMGTFMKIIEDYEFSKSYANVDDSVNAVHPYYPEIIASNRAVPITLPINNPYAAYSKGFEIDWQGSFIYLPRPFNGIVLNANYTYTDTEQTQTKQLISNVVEDPSRPWIQTTVVTDSAFTVPLFNQPKHHVNASIGYDYKGFSMRVAYTMKSEILVGFFGNGYELENEKLSAVRHAWDLSVKQDIPWVKGLQVFLNVSNISAVYSDKQFVHVTDKPDFPLYEQYFGRISILGLRYRL